MKITTINLQRTIPTGAYENVKIGAEASVGETETPEEALKLLSAWLDMCYRDMNIQEMRGTQERIIEKVEPKTQMEKLIEAIRGSSDLKVLDSFKILVKGKPEAETAYSETEKNLINAAI